MSLAYVTADDPNDVRSWSGVPVFMSGAFERVGQTVDRIGPLKQTAAGPSLVKRELYKRFGGRRYLRDRDPMLLHSYARQIERRLAAGECDYVVSPGSIPLSYLRTDKPVAFWTDISFAPMVDYYPEFGNLPARSRREGNKAEQAALDRCTVAIYSSEWARQLTLDHYNVDPAKVHVVPLGANITEGPTRVEVEQMIAARSREKCTLLFLAGAWTRKGGDKAFAVTKALNEAGLPTELVVCGGEPSPEAKASPHVTYLGYVSKGTPEGLAQWTQMLADAHFYVLPSLAETFGSATCEANAYGLPGLVNNVGGTSGVVTTGVNGQLFDADADPSVWRDYVLGLWPDSATYTALALSSVDEYAGRLNWETGCRAVIDMLQEA